MDSFNQGGSERQAVQLTRLLQESGRYRVHIACLHRRGVLLDELHRLGFEDVPEFPLTSFYDRNASVQLRRFVSFLREQDIKLVHTHDFYSNIFGMVGAALARMPARIASRRETRGTRTGAQKWAERRAYNLAHAVVANAEAVQRDLVEEGVSAKKIVTIYNGLDVEHMTARGDLSRDEMLAMFDLPREGERRFVTLVANLRLGVKDHPVFLRAAARVHRAIPEAAFVIAGEGHLMDEMRSLAAQLGLERDAYFIGECVNVPELLALSEVCVLSSRAEGFSNSILEYMAAARPVVATDVGGAREAIRDGETGHIVAVGDDEMMAAHIISLLRDREHARVMGARGRRLVEEKFSCEARLARTEEMYERLMTCAVATHPREVQGVQHGDA